MTKIFLATIFFLEWDFTFPPTPCYPPPTYNSHPCYLKLRGGQTNEGLTDRTDAMIVPFIVLDNVAISGVNREHAEWRLAPVLSHFLRGLYILSFFFLHISTSHHHMSTQASLRKLNSELVLLVIQ